MKEKEREKEVQRIALRPAKTIKAAAATTTTEAKRSYTFFVQ